MQTQCHKKVILAVALAIQTLLAAAADIVVAPDGDDAAPGTPARPVATLGRARELARRHIAEGLKADLVIELRQGVHRLDKPLELDAADGGTAAFAVRWTAHPDRPAIISGGTLLEAWERDDAAGRWSVAAPPGSVVSELSIGPALMTRARRPNAGQAHMTLLEVANDDHLRPATLGVPSEALAGLAAGDRIEIITLGRWASSRYNASVVDPRDGKLRLELPLPAASACPWNSPASGQFAWMEGHAAFIDQQGEWSLAANGRIAIQWQADAPPPPGTIHRLAELLVIRGDPRRPVSNLHFDGIHFAHTRWPAPAGGSAGLRSGAYATSELPEGQRPPAAVTLGDCRGVTMSSCVFQTLGGAGLLLDSGAVDVVVEDCQFSDIGGAGIVMDGNPDSPPTDALLRGNSIRLCGRNLHGSPAMAIVSAQGLIAERNRLDALPHSGISLGTPESDCAGLKPNIIRGNDIRGIGSTIGDAGGIHVFGPHPGSRIEANRITDIPTSPLPYSLDNAGILFDAGSHGLVLEGNRVTAHPPLRFQDCGHDDIMFGTNSFAAPGIRGEGLSVLTHADAIELRGDSELNPTNFTAECWFRWTHPMGKPGEAKLLIANGTDRLRSDGFWGIGIEGTSARGYLCFGRELFAVSSDQPFLKQNAWHHIAMTWDGAALACYVDGEPAGRTTIERTRAATSGTFGIGRRYGGFAPFRGIIDEVRLYRRALTADEIRANFQAMTGDTPPQKAAAEGLVRHWDFEPIGEVPGLAGGSGVGH